MIAAVCEHCGAPILWVTTLSGRPVPLDAIPASPFDDGVWIRYADAARAGVFFGRPYVPLIDGTIDVAVHRPHWEICPDADPHRAH